MGGTKRLVPRRLKEHIRHTKYEQLEKSAEHSVVTKYEILLENTNVLASNPFFSCEKIERSNWYL